MDDVDQQRIIDNRNQVRHCTEAECRANMNQLPICKDCGRRGL